jgi:hypothetical protein
MAGSAAQPPIAPQSAITATDLASIRINLFGSIEARLFTTRSYFSAALANSATVARCALIEREGVRKSQTVRRELDLN